MAQVTDKTPPPYLGAVIKTTMNTATNATTATVPTGYYSSVTATQCQYCKQMIPAGQYHTCNYNHPYQYSTCPKCAMAYTGYHYCQYGTHTTAVDNTQLTQINNTLALLMSSMSNLLKRIENIEKILDEEL